MLWDNPGAHLGYAFCFGVLKPILIDLTTLELNFRPRARENYTKRPFGPVSFQPTKPGDFNRRDFRRERYLVRPETSALVPSRARDRRSPINDQERRHRPGLPPQSRTLRRLASHQ